MLGLMLQGAEEAQAPMAQMLKGLPSDMKQALEQSLRQAMQEGIPRHMQALMPDQGKNTAESLRNLRHELEKQEQSQQTPIDIHHYHCDHLGTPLALTDSQGQIQWAARLDPWGNLEEEFNPNHIEQNIRLPGQHHDRETGLYYNRHRYYDPSIGSYINQDPIGLMGGVHPYKYVDSRPLFYIDPSGLQASYMCTAAGLPAWCPSPPKKKPTPSARPQACYRPLRRTPLVVGNQTDMNLNSVVGHQHIFFPDGTNIGYGPQGVYDDENIEEFSRCVDLNGTKENILKKVDELMESDFRPEQYNILPRALGGNNCQDFVEAVTGQSGI